MKTRFVPVRRPRWSATLRLLVAAVALAHVSASDVSAQRTLEALLQDTVLENGLHVVVVPNPTVPLATIQVTIRNGAFTQLTDADVGTPHVLEHMLFRSFGSDGFGPEAGKLEAGYNGTTNDETVTYYITLPSVNLAKGVQLMADLMRSPRFEREALESEQNGTSNAALAVRARRVYDHVDHKVESIIDAGNA